MNNTKEEMDIDIILIHSEKNIHEIPFYEELLNYKNIKKIFFITSNKNNENNENNEKIIKNDQNNENNEKMIKNEKMNENDEKIKNETFNYCRISNEQIINKIEDLKQREIFICGPENFNEFLLFTLKELNVSNDLIHCEEFNY
jgi:ferredoxin-NADP reductase